MRKDCNCNRCSSQSCNTRCCETQCELFCQPQCDTTKIVCANPNICCAPTICKQCTTVLTSFFGNTAIVTGSVFTFFAYVKCESGENLIISWPLSNVFQAIFSKLTVDATYVITVVLNLLPCGCNPCFMQPTASFSYVFSFTKTGTTATGSVQILNGTTVIATIPFSYTGGVFTTNGNFTPTVNVPFSSGGCHTCCCVTLAFPPGTLSLPTLCCGNGVGFF
ncbi:MAG: hypothetical protein Harvfovirus58_4 [Harvfovirus sp.]|uniref:Uncharacterized protein n=1 Tax=Harvfovirus sp. TaxID=2487768 RepID=A0A3G5A3E7_9VIRU|nr:MAG: hypothetical protein Harvfovirus58_4 [Harvfovirus sp.]